MTESNNPTNLDALTAKRWDNGGEFPGGLLQPKHQIELTNDAPADTAATSSTPYGFAQDQADDLIATVRELRAALIAVGICKDATANAD